MEYSYSSIMIKSFLLFLGNLPRILAKHSKYWKLWIEQNECVNQIDARVHIERASAGWPGIVYRSFHPSSMSEILAPVAIYQRHRHRQHQQQQQHHDLFIIIHELYEI